MKTFKVLFLCTGNSARSIMAEFLLRKIAPFRFEVLSAGSTPRPEPNSFALRVLRHFYHIDTHTAYSKSWNEFSDVKFDFVITLCDSAKETCPIFPGQPIFAHWSTPDPADFEGDDESTLQAFWKVSQLINRRLELFASLPFEKLDALKLELETRNIGNQP